MLKPHLQECNLITPVIIETYSAIKNGTKYSHVNLIPAILGFAKRGTQQFSYMMADKTTNNSESQELSIKIAVQPLLARIKKEEEEELWISGEELYTEGSSDEEERKTQSRSRSKANNNQSCTLPINRSSERRCLSPIALEIQAKSDHSKDDIRENQFVSTNLPTFDKFASKDSSHTLPMISQETNRIPTMGSSTESSGTNNSSAFSIDEDQIENIAISWKAKRELPYDNEELFENICEDDTDILNIDNEDEYVRKEVLEIKNLDNLIHAMNDKVKKANVETLFCQRQNRKRLEQILTLNPSESGKLAENTRQFFYLCPEYTTLNAEPEESNESYMSVEVYESKQLVIEDDTNLTININHAENVNANMPDSNSNPYVVNKRITDMLLAVEEKVLQEDVSDEQGQLLKEYDSSSNTTSAISILNSPSITRSSENVDYLSETLQELDQLIIVDLAEDL